MEPPSKAKPEKPDQSDDLAKLFDDGTELESSKIAPRPTSPQVTSPHLSAPQPTEGPVAPKRDFNRRPNSLERDALPAGLFTGTSKKTYDALFLRTRGANPPARTIQVKRKELMRWAGIGSKNTYLAHMQHLTKIGLLVRQFEVGDNDGAVYEVRIPEEIGLPSTLGSPRPTSAQVTSGQVRSPQPDSGQEVVLGSGQKMSRGEVGKDVDSPSTSAVTNTLKTTTIDDDDHYFAFLKLHTQLAYANFDITKKFPTQADQEAWGEVGKILAGELKEAASRARSVSSVPAFLAEHLRRRLAKPQRKGREEKRAPAVETPPQIEQDPGRRLTPEEITSYAATVTDLLKDGATLEDVTAQFAGSLHPEDWTAIRETATALVEQ